MAKNRLLANDASPSIGGFVYQVHLTIERWLNLQPEEILNLERGEDIDLVSCSPSGEKQVRLEQVKNYTSNVTLRSAVNYIAYFIEHRQNNSTKNLFFRYTTTSKVGTEQDLPEKLKKIPGIFVWEQIRQGCLKEISQNEALQGIRDILSRDVKKKPDKLPDKTWKLFCDFVKNASDDDILNLISRFEWRTEALELKLLIKNILNLLIEKQSEIPDGLQAQEQYERLFFYVFHLLSQPGLKQLSVEERNTQLNRRLSERESQEINSIVNQSISELERIKRLEELSRESRAWCIERFRVAILSRDEAVKLADDPSIGAPPPNLRLRAGKVILLTGEFGVGKTLIAQRLFQDAIKQACENVNAPVPIYLEAWQWKTERPLKKAVEKAAQGLGDLRTQGAVVIIDELDEAVNSLASQVLSEAYRLAETWENTTVVITSRSIRCIDNAEEAVPVPLLSEMQAYALIERVSDLQITAMVLAGWSKPVKEAIRYPLFALLLGRYLRQRDTELPRSKGELLSSLIEDALEQVGANRSSAEQLLKRLAKLSVECGSGLVRATDVAPTRAELQPLLDSRLVVERLGGITFPLPILTQWFAAQSLADGTSKVEDFVNVPQQLENWRYSLIIATATFGSELVSKLLTPIAQRYPAFASEIMNEGLVRRGYTQEIQLPPPDKCEQQIRMAMQAWARGIGPLAELIAPVRQGGKLLPIRARTDGAWLETAWYVGNKNIDVVELPPDWDRPESQEWNNWASGEGSRPGHQSAWAWRWAIDTLVSSLSRRLEAPTLPVSDGCLTREAAWRTALAIVEYQQRVGLTKRSLGKPDINLLTFICCNLWR